MNEELLGQMYHFIRNFMKENGFPPTRREMAMEFEIGVATAQRYIEELISEGLITVRPCTARGITLVSGGEL